MTTNQRTSAADEERTAKDRRTERWEDEGGASRPAVPPGEAKPAAGSQTPAQRYGADRRTITQDEQDRLAARRPEDVRRT